MGYVVITEGMDERHFAYRDMERANTEAMDILKRTGRPSVPVCGVDINASRVQGIPTTAHVTWMYDVIPYKKGFAKVRDGKTVRLNKDGSEYGSGWLKK